MTDNDDRRQASRGAWKIEIGHEELVIRRRYELGSIANDVLIALWFLVGSILFFWESTATVATWFFVLGSVEFLVRPVIRLARHVHLQRVGGNGVESANDF